METVETIVLGGGCFWCTEAVFSMFKGIVRTTPGYAGGTAVNPTYKQVCTGKTGHAEVLKIEYNPSVISIEKIFDIFFHMHDPTQAGGQGPDIGSQYRSIVLYTTEEQHAAANKAITRLQKSLKKPVLTEVRKLDTFYTSEDYHKDYYKNNPFQPYCMLVIRPKVAKIKKEFDLYKANSNKD